MSRPNRWVEALSGGPVLDPAIRRYLHHGRAQMAAFREPRPWTIATEAQRALAFSDNVNDPVFEAALSANNLTRNRYCVRAQDSHSAAQ
jgi:hypothetical protein